MQDYLSVSVREQGHSILVEVDGELDLASSPRLEQAIEQAGREQPSLVTLDLANLRFIDMAGLRVLLAAQRQAEREGRQLALARVRPPVRRVLELAQVGELFTILESAS